MTDCNNPVDCPNGNCPGCKDGKVWCGDPRCSPYCPGNGCQIPKDHDYNIGVVVIIILFCLAMILFIIWIAHGPLFIEYHNDHKRAGVAIPEHDHKMVSEEA